MRLLLASEEDSASRNIRARLIEAGDWNESGTFQGHPILTKNDLVMVTIDGIHIHAEAVDDQLRSAGIRFDEIIVLSRHRAASGITTLTVHPIGNYGKAEFGGREGTLVPAAPNTMTSLLSSLALNAKGLPYQVSFEVTHHGPLLSTPTCFIEIGSSEGQWDDEGAARSIATSILTFNPRDDPVAIGIGGGHYAPRFSEVCLVKKIAFGHMVPNYAMEGADDVMVEGMLLKAKEASNATLAYIHKKSMPKPRAALLTEMAGRIGLKVVESDDLEDRT